MNKHVHRLVFDRRRAMRVPAGEHVRSVGKAGGGESRAASSPVALGTCSILVALGTSLSFTGPTLAQQRSMSGGVQRSASFAGRTSFANLPVRSTSADRIAYDLGRFSINTDGRAMTVTQLDGKVIINWDSFNLGTGYSIEFVQPSATSSALNNIWSGDPSVILGHIKANGEVILQNRNGILFGPTARVDTGRFVATALRLTKETYLKGLRATRPSDVTFGGDDENPKGFITIERGAEIKATAGGDVIMVAPRVYNEGRIETPSGQTILAAGQKVYLYANTKDTVQRGLVVAVDAFATDDTSPEGLNTVEQAAAGGYQVDSATGETVTEPASSTTKMVNKINQVIAEKGSINLVGMTVRQNGVLTATTAVKGQNGAIFLQAMQSVRPDAENRVEVEPRKLGTVDIGAGSITSVTPDTSNATQTSSEAFYRSRINIDGKDVRIRSGALVQAVSGNIQVRASEDAADFTKLSEGSPKGDLSTLIVDGGATLTVAGLRDVALPMSRNQLVSTPFQIELANSPVQRNGVIYRHELMADARRQVSIADVSGFYNLIGRTAQEFSTRGGNIFLGSNGTTIVDNSAKLDISGGSVRYEQGQLYSSILSNLGRSVFVESADAATRYSALINPEQKNGALQTVASYAEGADAGSLAVMGGSYFLGGDVNASVVMGPYQRGGVSNGGVYDSVYGTTLAAGSLPDELGWGHTLNTKDGKPWLYASLQPKAGTLALGRKVGDASDLSDNKGIRVVAGPVKDIGAVPEAGTAEAQALFKQLGGEVQLSAGMVQAAGLSRLELTAGSPILIDADVSLNLGASGAFTARSKDRISLAGKLYAEGGAVSLTSLAPSGAGIVLAPGAVIDVSGRVADERTAHGQDAVSVDGGSISMSSFKSIDVSGATLDVSGGLWLSGKSRLQGKAGAISLAVNQFAEGSAPSRIDGQLLWNGATLSGYDFASGGTLTVNKVKTIAMGNKPASEQDKWAEGLNLSADFFSSGGFGSFNLSAFGDVRVFDGTKIEAKPQNLFVPIKAQYAQGESVVAGMQPVTHEDGQRSGVKIALSALTSRDAFPSSGLAEFSRQGSSITVGKDAVIDAGLAGAISLTAGLGIDISGKLIAHGGQIGLGIKSTRDNKTPSESANRGGYVPEKEIRLRAGSLLDVSGASKVLENAATHQRTGSVLAGGTVSLGKAGEVSDGAVFMEEGATINISGASDKLNVGARSIAPVEVSAGAGAMVVNATDGYVLQGLIKAARPNATVAGGSLDATVSLFDTADVVTAGTSPYPKALRETLLLSTQQAVVDATKGLAHAQFGLGLLSTQLLQEAGFDRISLSADDRITLGAGANLYARGAASGQPLLRSLALNTHVLKAGDEQAHTLEAGQVALGSMKLGLSASSTQELAAIVSSAGKATLNVNAGLIELNAYLGLAGFGTSQLNATLSADQLSQSRQDGEIRLIGRAFKGSGSTPAEITGQLNFAGRLNLTAGALYATTLSDFKIHGDSSNSLLTLSAPQAGSTAAKPLTALAHLRIDARDITLDGPVSQTFGQVDVTAGKALTVGEHARISVSGDGTIVPLGVTLNGAQWSYHTAVPSSVEDRSSVIGLDDTSLVKTIALKGGTLSLSDKAILSAKAGGDLQAWEFEPGVGGKTDELTKAGYYAVLPNYKYDFAPYDTEIIAAQKNIGTILNAGDKVTITTPNGVLATGSYTLLPARYALLPGAVLVKASNLAIGTTLNQAASLDDGSQMVSGHIGGAGTAIGSQAPGAALTLIPQATLKARSKYILTSIDQYKTDSYGATASPANAGRIQLASNDAFDVAAHFELNGGGELDLSMGQKMAVVAKKGDTVAGYATVSAQALETSGAHRVLLGGTREGEVGQAEVTATADEVKWATSVDTEAELVTVARNKVEVADGVSLKNHATADETAQSITLKGKGAALALTDRVNTTMTRDLSDAKINPSALGNLQLGQNMVLSGQGVLLDATGTTTLPTNLSFGGTRALSVGTGKLLLGTASTDTGVLALTADQMASLAQVERLSLHATDSITTYSTQAKGGLNIGSLDAAGKATLKSLTLDAPQLVGMGDAGSEVKISAQQVTLLNSGTAPRQTATSQTKLSIVSKPVLNDQQTGGITIGGSQDQHWAFNTVTLDTTGDVVIDGKKSTLSTQGDLTIKAARITGTNLAEKTLKAGGELTVAAVTADRHTLNEQRGAGQVLNLEAQRITQAGFIDLASGKLNVKASGGKGDAIAFAEGSTTNVAGRSMQAGTNWSVSSAGGTVTIQADAGAVVLDGDIDVSAGARTSASDSAKSAGDMRVTAIGEDGQVKIGAKASITGRAELDSLSGQLSIDTLSLGGAALGGTQGSIDRVAELANAGQMASAFDLRLRAATPQSLGTSLHAQRVNISSDRSSLSLLGGARIDASAPQGGVVALSARDDLTLADGSSIVANSTRAGANGGDVLLSSVSGYVVQNDHATVSATGDDARDGRIVMRAGINQEALAADEVDPSRLVKVRIAKPVKVNDQDQLKGLKAGEFTIEAVQVFNNDTDADLFQLLTGMSGSDAINDTISAKVSAFTGQIGAIQDKLGLTTLNKDQSLVQRGHVRLGIELQSQGDLTLVNDWNLAGLRLADEPIALTVRAGGNLNIKGSLSDGFETATRSADAPTALIPGGAASFRLIGGADLGAANAMATHADHGSGDVVIGQGKMVRTTAGSIEIAAAHDVVLEGGVSGTYTPQGTVYVAGAPLVPGETLVLASELPDVWPQFTDHGGRLEVSAGNDVRAPAPTQLLGNWFLHTGGLIDPTMGTEAWWTSFDSFKQGFGSFGGGNIRLEARGSVHNPGVAAPTSSVLLDHLTVTSDAKGNVVRDDDGNIVYDHSLSRSLDNGGDVTVKAGGDILGGVFLLGRGQGLIKAGGGIDVGTAIAADKIPAQSAMLGLMDGAWNVESRGSMKLGLVFNPTIMSSNSHTDAYVSYFYTYGETAALSASSVAGNLTWDNAIATKLGMVPDKNWLNTYAPFEDQVIAFESSAQLLAVAPPVVHLAAGGDLQLSLQAQDTSAQVLYPSGLGDLSIYASGAFKSSGKLVLADSDPSAWPRLGSAIQSTTTMPLPRELDPNSPQQTRSTLHQADATPVRIYAGGDMDALHIMIPKSAEVETGGDLIGAQVSAQHFNEDQRSLIKAGRDIRGQTIAEGASTGAAETRLLVSGPGELRVEAGRNVDLGMSSAGIQALGNAGLIAGATSKAVTDENVNPNDALPDVSAKLSVIAGTHKSVSLPEFQSRYLDKDLAAQSLLIEHVNKTLNLAGGNAYASALALYAQMSTPHHVAFADKLIQQRFIDKFVAPGKGYAAAWQAVATVAHVALDAYGSNAFLRFKNEVLMAEVTRLGTAATKIADSTDAVVNARNQETRQALWDELNTVVSLAGLGQGFTSFGSIGVASSRITTLAPGSKTQGGIDLYAPGGDVIVGLAQNNSSGKGVVTQSGGSIRAVLKDDFQVNSQKAFVVGVGDLTIYTNPGAIDSGRGSNTSVSAPPPVGRLVDGYLTFVPGATTTGSGLAVLKRPDGSVDGDVNLFAPVGGILALDTYIRNQSGSGSVNLAGPVKGADNVKGSNVTSTVAVAPPSTVGNQSTAPTSDTRAGNTESTEGSRENRKVNKNSLLTVDLLSIGGDTPSAGSTAPEVKDCITDKDCPKKK